MPSDHRDEFADSLARSQRRRAQAARNPPHPALLPRRDRQRAMLIAVLVVLAFFALVVGASILAVAIDPYLPGGTTP